MIVEKINKAVRGKVLIELSRGNTFLLHSSTCGEIGLSEGDELSKETVDKLSRGFMIYEFLSIGRDYLAYRMRSEEELRTYFSDKFHKKYEKKITVEIDLYEIIAEVIKEFEKDGLVDDKEFAKQFVYSRMEAYPRALWIIKGELQQKGVDSSIIEAVVAELNVTDEELLRRVLKKKYGHKVLGKADELGQKHVYGKVGKSGQKSGSGASSKLNEVERKKIITYLKGKGFNWEIISEAINNVNT